MTCTKVSLKEFEALREQTPILIVLFFSKEKREDARMVEGLLRDIDGRSHPNTRACKVDIEDAVELSRDLHISRTPTLVFFAKGNEEFSLSHAMMLDYIRGRLRFLEMMLAGKTPDM